MTENEGPVAMDDLPLPTVLTPWTALALPIDLPLPTALAFPTGPAMLAIRMPTGCGRGRGGWCWFWRG